MKGLVELASVGLGGFIGSSLRYLIAGGVQGLQRSGTFPVGTLAVNVIGCLLVGLVGGWAEYRQVFSPTTRIFVMIGVLGGFTTFSTFAWETMALVESADLGRALANVLLQVALGLAAAWLGFSLARGM